MAQKFAKLPQTAFVGGGADKPAFGEEDFGQKKQEMKNPRAPAPRVFSRPPFPPGVEREIREAASWLRGLYVRATQTEGHDSLIFEEFGLQVCYTADATQTASALAVLGVRHPVRLWNMLEGSLTALTYSEAYREAHGEDTRYPSSWAAWGERAATYLEILSTQEAEREEAGELYTGLRGLLAKEEKERANGL